MAISKDNQITRGQFIRRLAMLYPGLVLGGSLLSACEPDEDDPTPKQPDQVSPALAETPIVVIGAGAAGLAAANALQAAGLTRVQVVEARSRVGGRMFTQLHNSGFKADLGAAWVHGASKQNPFWQLVTQLALNTFKTDFDQIAVYDANNQLLSDKAVTDAEAAYNQILSRARRQASAGQSLQAAIEAQQPGYLASPFGRWWVSTDTEFDYGADASKLAAALLDQDDAFSGPDTLLPMGTQRIAESLSNPLTLFLEHPVEKIRLAGIGPQTKVVVQTPTRNFEAQYVICTLPLGVLQHNPDLFDPQLPTQHQAALSKMYPGLVNKCFLGFDTAFWDPKLHFFGTLAPDKGRYNLYHNCQLHTNQPVLCTFGFGDFAYAFEQQTEADRLAEIHERLKGMFGNNTPAPNWAIASAWHADPYAKGSYSSPVVGLTGQEANVWATPAAEDKVWFAGEHTSTKYRGTVHGALLSGQSVAAALIRALQ